MESSCGRQFDFGFMRLGSDQESGAGNIGTGAVQGARDLAKGTAKGAVNLATLHPIDAGVSIGKGAVKTAKTLRSARLREPGKIGKGVGRAIKKVL